MSIYLDNIKLIASELSNMAPKTQLEIIKLCKELCIDTKNYLVEMNLDENTITTINNRLSALEGELSIAENNIQANANAIEGLSGSVEGIVEALTNIYTKTEINALLLAKADKLTTYTKTEISAILNDYYTKNEVNTNFYNKTYIDNNFYGATEIDDTFYNKTQIDTNIYTKAQSNQNFVKTGTLYIYDLANLTEQIAQTDLTSLMRAKSSAIIYSNQIFTIIDIVDHTTYYEYVYKTTNIENNITIKLTLNTATRRFAIANDTIVDLSGKQDTLTAGTGISIQNNVISATGGSLYLHTLEFKFYIIDEETTYSWKSSFISSEANSISTQNMSTQVLPNTIKQTYLKLDVYDGDNPMFDSYNDYILDNIEISGNRWSDIWAYIISTSSHRPIKDSVNGYNRIDLSQSEIVDTVTPL